MRMKSSLIVLIVLSLTVAPAIAKKPPKPKTIVYVSSPTDGTITEFTVSGDRATVETIYEGTYAIEGLTLGPTGSVYACAPDDDYLIIVDPTMTDPPQAMTYGDGLQCGWFAHTGEFLTGGPGGLYLDGAVAANYGALQEVTQEATGDALAAAETAIVRFPATFDSGTSFEPGDPLVTASNPNGLVRLSNGDFYFTSVTEFFGYSADGTEFCSYDFGEAAFGVDSAADNTMYVATTGSKGALWRVNPDCSAKKIKVQGNFSVPDAWGVAVAATKTAITETTDYTGVSLYDFKDNTFEVAALQGCEATVVATETLAPCLDEVTGNLGLWPVIAHGDGGLGQVYYIEDVSGCDAPAYGYLLAASAYTDILEAPYMVRCDATGDLCEDPASVVCAPAALSSYSPLEGRLPNDGRIGARAATFSQYFVAQGAAAYTEEIFCGFEPPLYDIAGCDDSAITSINAGSTMAIKFLVNEPGSGSTCQNPPYLNTGVTALLSIVKIEDGDGYPDFQPIEPPTPDGSGFINADGQALFSNPNGPSTPYHFNLNTSGYEPGCYQVVVIPLEDGDQPEFAPQWTYFAVN